MTVAPVAAHRWRSWHLHTDSVDPQALDRLLIDVAAPLIGRLAAVGQPSPVWFFVRYWLYGPHLRLRIADLGDAQADAVERELESLVASVSADFGPRTPADDDNYRRASAAIAAAGEAGVAIDSGHLLTAGVYRQVYEPEYDRYGGAALMPVSERLFCAASATALAFCEHDNSCGGPLARGLEALAVSCGTLRSDPTEFLTTMRDRWTQWLAAGQPHIDAAVIDRAAVTSAAQIAVAGPALVQAVHGGCPPRWSPWVRAVGTAMDSWQDTLPPAALRGVFGSHLHMMQNRLGVGAGSEAYLAAILLRLLADA